MEDSFRGFTQLQGPANHRKGRVVPPISKFSAPFFPLTMVSVYSEGSILMPRSSASRRPICRFVVLSLISSIPKTFTVARLRISFTAIMAGSASSVLAQLPLSIISQVTTWIVYPGPESPGFHGVTSRTAARRIPHGNLRLTRLQPFTKCIRNSPGGEAFFLSSHLKSHSSWMCFRSTERPAKPNLGHSRALQVPKVVAKEDAVAATTSVCFLLFFFIFREPVPERPLFTTSIITPHSLAA